MQYAVIEMDYLPDLIEAVNEEIAKGWRPLGGVSTTAFAIRNERSSCDDIDRRYVQAMTRDAVG